MMMNGKTYGTMSPEQQKAMSGLEFVQGLASGALPLNTIAQTLDYDIVEAETGRVVITVVPNGSHLNPWGTVQAVSQRHFSTAAWDWPFNRRLRKASPARRSNSKFRSSAPSPPETGEIRAEGKILNAGGRIGTAEGRVIDKMGRLLAHGTTTCFIFEN
jgi:acyl-coenzyme A thioesterase PaaI-like protein